jgi:hypothetical protein
MWKIQNLGTNCAATLLPSGKEVQNEIIEECINRKTEIIK